MATVLDAAQAFQLINEATLKLEYPQFCNLQRGGNNGSRPWLTSQKAKRPDRSTYHDTAYELFSLMNRHKRLIKPLDLMNNWQEIQRKEEYIKKHGDIIIKIQTTGNYNGLTT